MGEIQPPGAFGAYRLWLTAATVATWAGREKLSNENLDGTFVYGDHRVIYNAGAHYSGSPYTTPGYTSPVGALCGYDIIFPADDPFLGSTHMVLDWPVRDDTDQREQLMFWFLEQYGLPNMYRRYVIMFVNGAVINVADTNTVTIEITGSASGSNMNGNVYDNDTGQLVGTVSIINTS